MLLIYGVALALIGATGWLVYRLLAHRSPVMAAFLALLAMTTAAALWPLPIHGGLTFLGAVALDELRAAGQRREQVREAASQRALEADLGGRFHGPIDFHVDRPLGGGWSVVRTGSRQRAWHHDATGLVWSEWLNLGDGAARPSLDAAKARCAAHSPAGYWALPTEAEQALLWLAGGQDRLPPQRGSTIGYLVDEDLHIELATYSLRPAAGGWPGQQGGHAAFEVRCVARAAGAPPGGYTRRDVSLEQWNRYQVGKLGG